MQSHRDNPKLELGLELDQALGEISNIRRQMAQSTEFRGYGPATLAATGALALLAAGAQARWLPEPASHIGSYLALWIGTAVVSAALIGVEMMARTQRMHTGMADEMIRMAVEQFAPSVLVGGLVTLVMVRSVPASVWMLPGVWLAIFSLGVFSACRFLPREIMAAGVWYLLAGLTALALGDARALQPQVMGAAFGVGQVLVAAILLLAARGARHEE